MAYFIFQGNPDQFDIDSYVLDAVNSNQPIRWSVSRYKKDIQIGDTVFLWRASGKKKSVPGAIAVCRVVTLPALMPEDELSKKYWKDSSKLGAQVRSELRILKTAVGNDEVVSRDTLKNDPLFKDATIITIPNATNFSLNDHQGKKLLSLLNEANKQWATEGIAGGDSDYWLILEKSDETRISKGIEGYKDRTGEVYHYDSLVPNYKNLKIRDRVVLRKENKIVGIGTISKIEEFDSAKLHGRCPSCESTDIRERKYKSPKWKCGKCVHEFDSPYETIADVKAYQAEISNYSELPDPPEVMTVKACAEKGDGVKSQLSILKLDAEEITNLIKFPSVGFGPEFVDENLKQLQEEFESEVKKSGSDTPEERQKRLSSAPKKPTVVYIVTKTYRRNADVVTDVLARADGFCEECHAAAPFIRRSDETPYLEVHHKIQLADGGEDTIENALAVCPNCHRRMHYGLTNQPDR
jgi:predicted RNA-binding protein with PUA-like domain